MNKKILLGMTLAELREVAKSLGMPAFAGDQMAKWLYGQHVRTIDEMTNLSKANRALLAESYEVGCMDPIDAQHSKDGTVKYLFPVRTTSARVTVDASQPTNPPSHQSSNFGGMDQLTNPPTHQPTKFVEAVFIPDEDRGTLCVSCEVGCKMNCLFCQTGKQGFEGYLSAADILNQIYSLPERDRLTNIVFMGQGEPMDNLDQVLRTTEVLTAPYAYAWSPKRITVSSIGVKDKLRRFLDESDCHVAISLHSPIHEQRLELMPGEKVMPIEETVELLRNYDFSHQRRLSFEYIVFGGVNDSMTHAREVVRLLKGLFCRVNLIRFHQIPNVPLHGADDKKMETFRDYLTAHGIFTTIRASRGEDIFAACGLLSTSKKIAEDRKR